MNSRNLIIAMAIHYQGDVLAITQALLNKEFIDEAQAETYLKSIKCNVLTILDKEYPCYLKEIRYPPIVLFYYGDISLLSDVEKNLAVVGSRKASEEGRKNVYYIVSNACKRYNIVSGLAKGIDTIAHKAAIDNGGRTIAVLANGIEYCYPSCNSELYKEIKKKHLVISEYYGYVSPEQIHFHQRNRLIAGLAKGTLIGEASRISGTLITANYTLEIFRQLMVIPNGDIKNSLNDLLIKEGAPVVTEPQDVIDYLSERRNSLLCEVK